jgi:proteasome lid subunit RPN8/RPN11
MKATNPRWRMFPDQIVFSPLEWLKLQWLCHAGPTEVGGFGISREDQLLHIEDFIAVKQYTTPVTVRFDDQAVADFYDGMVDRGVPLRQFSRLWIHTHPGSSAEPSGTDEETFVRTFGSCDWAMMFIVSRTGQTYARLSFFGGPGGQVLLPTAVQWSDWPATLTKIGSLDLKVAEWRQEFEANVNVVDLVPPMADEQVSDQDWWDSHPWSHELDGTVYEVTPSGANDEFPF